MSLINLSLLSASTLALTVSLTPPTPPAPSSERVKVTWVDIAFTMGGIHLMKAISFTPCAAAIAVVVATKYPSAASSQILSVLLPSGWLQTPTVSRYLLTGVLASLIGAASRVWCYRTLGRHFTYQLSILKGHRLMTGGPYAIVRHPSYTAGLLVFGGLTLVHLAPGSFTRSCGWLETILGKTLFSAWISNILLSIWMICIRTKKEDSMLKGQFGVEWESVPISYKRGHIHFQNGIMIHSFGFEFVPIATIKPGNRSRAATTFCISNHATTLTRPLILSDCLLSIHSVDT
ncbi:hypothetical protein BJ138DRAFT_581287 [Hygrophoropsis aurantiaca]|uniref:Uncharacterized protein n=1 Tax=Hygrophoropsis aurantiaca TaxID=72124 RepID=A0ACB8AK32_9AGAM|nr:hypothetical protein BJ138DRAFT_581287 [Hygrophoropsis aurantiaca]